MSRDRKSSNKKRGPGGESTGTPVTTDPKAEGSGHDTGVVRHKGRVFEDLTVGSIPKKLFSQAWPQTFDSMLLIADQLVDLVWAGRLPEGFRAVAGIGVGQTIVQFFQMGRVGLDQALRAMVSRAVGAGNIDLANHVLFQAFIINGLYAIALIIFGQIFTPFLVQLVGGSGEIQSQASIYMRAHFVTAALITLRQTGTSGLQASADVMTPLRATTVTRIVHIISSPFLMFGWGWFPEMGIAGAPAANALGWVAGNSIIYYALFKGNSRLRLNFKGQKVDFKVMWQMIKIGAPASVVGTERATSQLFLLSLASGFGEVSLAAYSIVRRLENFLNFGSMGVAQAAGTMVGQNLGAGKPDRAKKSVLWALLFGNAIPGVVRIFLIFAPTLFVTIFTSDPDVKSETARWLQIQVVAVMFIGMATIFQQSFNTAGDTLVPMIVTLIAVWAVEIPLAFVLANHTGLGAIGIIYAGMIGGAIRLLLFVPYFFWGRWTTVKVLAGITAKK